MPEIPDVVTLTTISSDWGNDIRDRTVQRYSSVSNRSSEHASPTAGDLSYLEDTGDVAVYHGGLWKVPVPVGALIMFGSSASAPDGWLLCNGAAVSRTTYAVLFGVIGTNYGVGNGSTTFNVPDLRQRFPLGVAASGTGATLGETGGTIGHVHAGPSHTHTVDPPNTQTADNINTVGLNAAVGGINTQVAQDDHPHTVNIAEFNTGASGTGNTNAANPPFVTVHFLIKI